MYVGDTLEVTYRVSDNTYDLDAILDIQKKNEDYLNYDSDLKTIKKFTWSPPSTGEYTFNMDTESLIIKVTNLPHQNNIQNRYIVDRDSFSDGDLINTLSDYGHLNYPVSQTNSNNMPEYRINESSNGKSGAYFSNDFLTSNTIDDAPKTGTTYVISHVYSVNPREYFADQGNGNHMLSMYDNPESFSHWVDDWHYSDYSVQIGEVVMVATNDSNSNSWITYNEMGTTQGNAGQPDGRLNKTRLGSRHDGNFRISDTTIFEYGRYNIELSPEDMEKIVEYAKLEYGFTF